MKKLISAFLILCMLSGYAFAAENAVEAVEETLPEATCIYDSYTSYGELVTGSERGEVILAGTVYDRFAIVKFDISDFAGKTFGGNLFSLTVRNSKSPANVSVYSFDENAENIKDTFEVVTVATLSKTGKLRCDFVASKYITKLLAEGKTTACFAIRTDAKVMSIFSSDYPVASERPSLVCTEGEAYVRGQKDYEYPKVTRDELKVHLADAVKKGHPRLMATKEDFDRVRSLCFGKDEFLTEQYQAIKKRASKYLGKAPETLPNGSYISYGVEKKDMILDCAFVYLMEGDVSYASVAVSHALYFANLETWGTYQYIDNNQLGCAVAFCYDWLYDYLSEGEKETLKNALREKHLDDILDHYRNPNAAKYQNTFHLILNGQSNHAVLDHTSQAIQAIAIAEDDIDYSAEIIENAFSYLEKNYDGLYPDGAWVEGVGYWDFVGPYIARMFATLEASFGTYFGFENCTAVVNTSDYPVYAQSSQKAVLFCDSGTERNTDYEKYYFGKMTGNTGLMSYSLKNDKKDGKNGFPLLCLWYDTELDHDASMTLANDKLFRNVDMAVMRSDFEGNQEVFAAMVVARVVGHSYMAMGTFNYDALGERWITIPGRDSYSLPGYYDSALQGRRWKYYFSRAEANNCIVINPSEFGGQNIYSEDDIDVFESEVGGAYTVADLADAYQGQVKSYKRALGLFEDRRIVVLQDELVMEDPSEMYSFINFVANDFEITPDNDVIVRKGNKKIYVNIICDQPYEVSIMQARGLPTSNIIPGERRLRDMKKIAIHFEEISKANLRVEFIPYLFDEEIKDVASRKYVPISEWVASKEECDVPMLKSLSMDSVPYSEFNPYNRYMEVDTLPEKVDVTVDESKYNVTVEKIAEKELFKILVTDKANPAKMNSYIVCTPDKATEPVVIDTTGHKELAVAYVKATTDDGNVPANTIDGDMDTRWSASGDQSLTLELEKPGNVYCIAIAFYSGSIRKAYFDLEVSEDGKNWTTVSENESSGKTDDFEYFDISKNKIKYIRYKGYGNSTGQWNSIAEIKVFEK